MTAKGMGKGNSRWVGMGIPKNNITKNSVGDNYNNYSRSK